MGGKNKNQSEYELVYSTDPIPAARCERCNKVSAECICKAPVVISDIKPNYRIERKGRGGKTVTLIGRLPAHEPFLTELCAYLKKSVGGGGTSYIENGGGIIEIQGERMKELEVLVEKYKTTRMKRAGK